MVTTNDADTSRLLCAWCGEPLSATEVVLHEFQTKGERFGWHLKCYDVDFLIHQRLPWYQRRAFIESRGPGRVGEIVDGTP